MYVISVKGVIERMAKLCFVVSNVGEHIIAVKTIKHLIGLDINLFAKEL